MGNVPRKTSEVTVMQQFKFNCDYALSLLDNTASARRAHLNSDELVFRPELETDWDGLLDEDFDIDQELYL